MNDEKFSAILSRVYKTVDSWKKFAAMKMQHIFAFCLRMPVLCCLKVVWFLSLMVAKPIASTQPDNLVILSKFKGALR